MSLKERAKTYNFWVSLASAIFLIINIIGQKFNFYVDEGIFNDLFTAICAILVLLGIIVPPKNKSISVDTKLFDNNEFSEPSAALPCETQTVSTEESTAEPGKDEQCNTTAETELAQEKSDEIKPENDEPDSRDSALEQPGSEEGENTATAEQANETCEGSSTAFTLEEGTAEPAGTESEEDDSCVSSVVSVINNFSGSKEELKQLLYTEIEKLDK